MRKTKIISVAAVLTLACAVFIPTVSSFALGTAEDQSPVGNQNSVSTSSDYQSLQILLGRVYLIPDYAANPALSVLVNRAEALSENSDPAEIALVREQLTSLVASIPASTAYDVGPTSDGSGSGGGSGDPADEFEDKHEPTSPQSGSNSSQTTNQDPQVSTSSSNKRSNSGAAPNTGVADHAAAANAVASSTIFAVAGVLATLGFCLYRHHTAKK